MLWDEFLAGIEMMPEDFMPDGREQEFQQEREIYYDTDLYWKW